MKLTENIQIPKKMIESVSVEKVKDFLEKTGWQRVEFMEPIEYRVLIFYRNAPYEPELVLPIKKDLKNFALRMSELLLELSRIEDVTVLSLIEMFEEGGGK